LAVRYSGASLPRVKYWEPWDEPNLPAWFGAPNPVSAYRTLLNRAYDAVKAVHKDNLVFLGGLAPVRPYAGSFPPLDFAAQVLCLRRVGRQFRGDPSCHYRAQFDVFAMHSYTLGATPTKHAAVPGDVFVGDMGEVRNLVQTVDSLRTAHHQIWVTEFAWFTNPPNPGLGDPGPTAARYVAYSMYEMWNSGVSSVFWQSITDLPPGYSDAGRGYVWGRVPVSRRSRVVVQRLVRGQWRTVSRLRTGTDGVFYATFPARGNGLYRAQASGQTSLAYNSAPIPPIYTHPLIFG
jgi:hypothetical protein